jgi:hypothetical protein
MFRVKLKLITLADVILIICILAGAALSYVYIRKVKNDLVAYVYYHNRLINTYDLSKPQSIEINAQCKAEIKDGKIRMLQADCRDKLCVKQGWSDMLPIICLPNQIVIEVKNRKAKQQIHMLH